MLTTKSLGHFSKYATPTYIASRAEKISYQYGFADASHLSLPNFLCAGFRKTGTTWLYENLFLHPELYLPPYKNVRYFSNDFTKPLETYAQHFAAGGSRVKGDFSNSYSFISVHRVRFIRAVMPDVKLIFLLRNPVERTWSEFIHQTKEQERPVSTYREDEIIRAFRSDPIIRAGGYTAVLDKWLRVFPSEQVFVGFYEDVKKDPKTLLTNIFRFLGVSADIDWSEFPYNACIIPPAGPAYSHHNAWRGVIAPEHQNSAELLEPRFEQLLRNMLEPELLNLEARFGPKVRGWR